MSTTPKPTASEIIDEIDIDYRTARSTNILDDVVHLVVGSRRLVISTEWEDDEDGIDSVVVGYSWTTHRKLGDGSWEPDSDGDGSTSPDVARRAVSRWYAAAVADLPDNR